jgi:hypothetical protein
MCALNNFECCLFNLKSFYVSKYRILLDMDLDRYIININSKSETFTYTIVERISFSRYYRNSTNYNFSFYYFAFRFRPRSLIGKYYYYDIIMSSNIFSQNFSIIGNSRCNFIYTSTHELIINKMKNIFNEEVTRSKLELIV